MINNDNNNNYNNENNDNQNGLGENTTSKKNLKRLGFFFAITGGILFIITLIDFFTSANNFRRPNLFFLGFIGLPMLGIGLMMLSYAYIGKITRFTSREVTPVIKDSANYLFNGTKETLKNVYSTVKGDIVKCRVCNTVNDKEARFCKGCGQSIKKQCPYCNIENDSDSKFCNNCGKSLL